MCGELRGGHDGFVGNDDIAGAIIEYADDGTVLHGALSKIAHTFVGSLTIKVASFQVWQRDSDRFDFTDGRQCFNCVVYILGDIDSDISTVALGPSFLTEISCNFSYLVDFRSQCWTIVKN